MLKGGIRILAIEDAPFKRPDRKDLIVGVIGRNELIEGILSSSVTVDGDDATSQILKMINSSRFKEQIAIVVLNGITVAGLNVIDIQEISKKLGIPVIAITRKRPRATLLGAALRKYGSKKNLVTLKRVRETIEVRKAEGYFTQSIGIDEKSASKVIKKCVELLRIAHLIASGVKTGESKGRI